MFCISSEKRLIVGVGDRVYYVLFWGTFLMHLCHSIPKSPSTGWH